MATRSAALAVAAAVTAVGAVTGLPAGAQARVDTSAAAVVRAATAYVETYTREVAYLLADEAYTQTWYSADATPIQTRVMQSELFLTYLAADREWIAVRDVIDVDGIPLQNREDLRRLLAQGRDLRGIAARVAASNARFNIGRTERNFNEPTLPLLLFDTRRVGRVRFDRRQVVRDADATLVTLAFTERDRPTLVATPNGGALPARGEIVVDAATGVIRRTTFELSRPDLAVRLATTYERHPTLDLWLPATFTERYETRGSGSFRDTVACEARYTNYRRFEVLARIRGAR